MKRLTDPSFKYVPASKTDIRKTFARVRRELNEKKPDAQPRVFRLRRKA